MIFHYIASQSDGKIIESDYEAEGTVEVLEFLSSRGLKPISIKVLSGKQVGGRGLFSASINITDKVFLTKYLALMLKVGTDLFHAIDVLIADFDKPALKAVLIETRTTLEKGQPFYVTFSKYPNIFDDVFVNLVKAGELSGNLDRVFEDLSVFLQKQQELRSRIRGALIYPMILFSLSFLILIFLLTFALPQIAGVFQGSGFEPPLFSRVVFGIGLFFSRYIIVFALLVVIALAGAIYFFKTAPIFRRYIFRLFSHLPVIKNVIQKIALQRFASTFSSLVRAGLPVLEAIDITAIAVGNEEFKVSLLRISREGISKGLTIGEAFKKEVVFPQVISNLIAISEKAGHLEEVLTTLSTFYESEIDTSIKTLVSFLEPMLLLFIGVIIGGIALSIIVPIYQLITAF